MMIIGHSGVINDLKRLANSGSLSHAYLFCGPSMAGKRTVALALANFLEKRSFAPPAETDVLQDMLVIDTVFMKRIDPDNKGSIGIDAVRELKNFLWQKPNTSPRRTLIIDCAELMTGEAQNAILKIAEEPPPSSLIILITSDPDSLGDTVKSRLVKIYFSTVPRKEMANWLEKERKIPKQKAESAAEASHGLPGLALAALNDEKFKLLLKSAELFLKTAPAARRDFIKELIEPEDFSFSEFLDILILLVGRNFYKVGASPRPPAGTACAVPRLWHKLLELRGRVAYFPLNPRLQLENLLLSN